MYAYNNLDIDLKQLVPTAENPQNTLVHLTTGTMIPLEHQITASDLDCSDFLWKKHQNNLDARPHDLPRVTFEQLLELHPKTIPPDGLHRRKRFNAWKYLSDLVEFGPPYFQKFKKNVGDPEVVEAIPLVKTTQVPMRTLDISPNTPGTNATALEAFFKGAGVGDPTIIASVHDPKNLVMLVSGDLLTVQHLHSLRASRAEESTSWGRMQFIVLVMGLFHLKMACADSMWRIFIHNKAAQTDPNNLMAHVSQIRPKETRKIETKLGFRRMHECIQHVGIVSRLEVWRIAAATKMLNVTTLDDFAKLEPDWELLQEMANMIVMWNGTSAKFSRMRTRKSGERDKQFENMILHEEYFLLYEEILHGLNHGDIGHVETCFMPWIYIFAGCGKHKYAAEM